MTVVEICVLVVFCVVFLLVICAYMHRDFGEETFSPRSWPDPPMKLDSTCVCEWCNSHLNIDGQHRCVVCGAPGQGKRRVLFVDVGQMPAKEAKRTVEAVKDRFRYNPLAPHEDFYKSNPGLRSAVVR